MYAFKPYVFSEHSPNSIAKPEGRMISRIWCDGKNLYIYNGMNPTATRINEFRDFWVYNLAGQQWKLMRNGINIPDQARIIGTIFDSNYLVICTVQSPLNEEMSSRLHICDLNTESVLVQETSGPIPSPTFGTNLIRHGKYFYTVGTTRDSGPRSDVYKLNMENGVWEIVYICREPYGDEPYVELGHTLVYGNNRIYIFGGGDDVPALDTHSLEKIWAFDLEKCCWKEVETHGDENHTPQYPADREGISVTSYTDPDSGEINVIISGGADYDYEYDNDGEGWEGFNKSISDVFNDVWRLNLSSLKWTCLERFGTVLPCHVEDHSMTISPAGKLFTFGGRIFNNKKQVIHTSTLHSTWLRIPKLTDICWEAVFHYYPNLTSMTDKEIAALGIPPKLLKSRIN